MSNKQHQDLIQGHLEHVEEETNNDIVQIAFNCLKERVVLRKVKLISDNCFRLKTLRKYFYALQQYDLRQKIFRDSAKEIRKIQEAKYLWHWRKAYLKEREKNQVSEFIQTSLQYQILQFWKTYTQKRIRARNFFKNVVQRNMKSFVLEALQCRMSYEASLAGMGSYLEKVTKQNTVRRSMYAWLQKTQEQKIEKQMIKFYQIKLLRDVVAGWRIIKDKNNAKRLRVYRIREQLNARPELGRPLKALKNFLLFRAFNKLCEGATQVLDEEQKTEHALMGFYLYRVRKTFLALKLNTQINIQGQKAEEISDLFMKKRWLGYMVQGTQYLKARRKQRQTASIFRFLSLQKKALQALLAHTITSQELVIKKEYAMRLYYNRLLEQAMSSLKIYKGFKAQQRRNNHANTQSFADNGSPGRSASRSVSAEIRQYAAEHSMP